MPLRVLVVEDNPLVLEFITEVLASLGVEVRGTLDSQEGSGLIASQKFDAVFLDLMMPHVDGFELAQQVRRSSWNRSTPIVVITGFGDEQAMAQAFEAGGTFFLAKPVDKVKLTRLFKSVEGSMIEERLRYRRVPVATTVKLEAGGQRSEARSVNLSQDGMLLENTSFVREGNPVWIAFRLTDPPATIEAGGVAVRVDAQGRTGIRFTWISPEHRMRIRDLVLRQADVTG